MVNDNEGLKWFDYRGIYKNGEGYYWWRSSDNSERPSIIYVFKESVDYIWIAQNGKGLVSNKKYRLLGLCVHLGYPHTSRLFCPRHWLKLARLRIATFHRLLRN